MWHTIIVYIYVYVKKNKKKKTDITYKIVILFLVCNYIV